MALLGGQWIRVSAMGVLLAALVFVTFFYQPSAGKIGEGSAVEADWDATPVPELDSAILALARDATRSQRLNVDDEPLAHLLERSLAVTPAVARKLGMPERPTPAARLRNAPGSFRGRFLWAKGKLEYLSKPKPGHPVPGYDHFEARLRTEVGEPVLFSFSVPPPEGVKIGGWVRIEGFFLKLRDAHLPVELNQTPWLVGPELFTAYPDWEAVGALDPAVLNRVRDGEWKGESKFENGPDIDKLLAESEDVPLWHLASYALNCETTGSDRDAWWSEVPALSNREQFEAFRRGDIPKGTPMRLLGTFVHARVMPAKINPLGIEAWTEAWVQVRDIGGKTIPVWIPRRISESWRQNHSAVVHGYFFKRYRYETMEGEVRWTPLFVAADMTRFTLSTGALSNQFTIAFAGLVGLVATIFFFMSRRDRRQRQRHEADLVARRRKRRGGVVAQA